VIFITGGGDVSSAKKFRALHGRSYWPIPSMFSPDSLPSDTSYSAIRAQFLNFMDSVQTITNGVNLHVVVMDSGRMPDDSALYVASVIKTGGTFTKIGGKGLVPYMDTLFTRTHDLCRCGNVWSLPNEPVLIDHLAPGLHYIEGSIQAGNRNVVPFDSVVIDSSASGTFFKYYRSVIYTTDVFEYCYRFQAGPCDNGQTVVERTVNPDTAFSRFLVRSRYDDTVSFYFPADTFWINCTPISVEQGPPVAAPAVCGLEQNLPNPFNPATTINYQLPLPEHVRLDVFDISGNLVETLVNENKPAGYYTAVWNAKSSPSGIYYFKLKAGNFKGLSKGMLIK
jgi:hypothetical protein